MTWTEHLPVIAIEIVMIFGGALAFGWWQLRDLEREKRKRDEQREAQREPGRDTERAGAASAPPDPPR